MKCAILPLVNAIVLERDDFNRLYIIGRVSTKGLLRLKTGVEPIWLNIMPCASFYSILKSSPKVSRMFQRNLEYTSTFYNKT